MSGGYGSASLLGFSDFNGTKIIAADCGTVYIYTEDGQEQRKIKLPEGQGLIKSGAINYVTKHILVKTYQPLGSSLLSFSDTGELIDSLCLGSTAWIRLAFLLSPEWPSCFNRLNKSSFTSTEVKSLT
ncbi:Hypothetical predicted protein [Paramuricea clavata]|uniref:Uncharacterized protein n=1 Tax=Paramuricea clavata TaxID=317549 RepID=A0A6S7JTD0_PARCT|nr:Hypothetical predicted protein [Paramuricea clavata]